MSNSAILDKMKSSLGIDKMPDVFSMLSNFDSSIGPIIQLIGALSYLGAFILILMAMKSLADNGSGGQQGEGYGKPIVCFIAAVMLVYLPTSIDSISMTMLGAEGGHAFSYTPDADMSAKVNAARKVIFHFIYAVGMIAAAHGIWMLKDTVSGNSNTTVGKCFMHIIGGTLAMQLDKIIGVFGQTVGLA